MKIADFLNDNSDVITKMARPFTIYLGGLSCAIGVFVPAVSADKLWVVAGLAGSLGVARSIDNHAEAKYGATAKDNQQ